MELMQTMGIGLVVSLLFMEFLNLSPGGLIVPGYIALTVEHPGRILMTLAIAAVTWLVVWGISHQIVLFGRRRLATMILIGFLLKWACMAVFQQTVDLPIEVQAIESIGFVIPGLIANTMEIQGWGRTLGGIAIASALVKLLVVGLAGRVV